MSRVTKNRQYRCEALREELKSREYVRQVHTLLDGLRDSPPNDALKLGAVKLQLDGYFRLLNKCLPDLRSLDMKTELKADNDVASLLATIARSAKSSPLSHIAELETPTRQIEDQSKS